MDAIKELSQHPLFQMISFGVGILGVILAVIFFRLSLRNKKPLWTITSNNLVRGFSGRMPQLEVKYANESVESLTVSRIVFWNGGRETVDRTDIAAGDPLRIVTEGEVRLLDVTLLKTNSESSRFLVSRNLNAKAAYLEFDFLDKNQGAVFQIIHNGTSSKDLRLAGTIKGVETIKRREFQFYTSRVDFILQNLNLFFGLVAFPTLAVIGVWEYLHEKGSLITPLVWAAMCIFMIVLSRLSGALARFPKGLKILHENL